MASFNGGLSGGIVPGGAIGAQLSAITRRAAVPSVFVQIYQAHPLLSLLLSNAQSAKGGISQVTIPAQGASFVQFSWGSFAGDFPMPEDEAAIQNAQFNLKVGICPIGFFGMEALIQSSEVIIPKLRAVMSDAAIVIKQNFASALYSNNYANTLAFDSLYQAYDNGVNVPAYGGITRAGNNWWNGQYIPNQAAIANRTGMAITLSRVQNWRGRRGAGFRGHEPCRLGDADGRLHGL